MTCLSKRKFVICMVTFSICLSLLVAQAFSLSLEQIISRRMSTRSYTSESISGQQLLEVLQLVYGYNNGHRSVPQIGDDYSLVIFPYNETGSYRYVPENNSLIVHDLTVNKDTVPAYDYYDQTWVKDANVILAVVWNQTRMSNGYFASAEAGCFVQNTYLAAISNDLGTCCVGSIRSEELRDDLNLPGTLFPLLVMPLGYRITPYPPASPYDYTTGNLPPVQYSSSSFEDAVRNMVFTQEWAAEDLSLQELSQLLWAAYGYTNITAGWHKAYHKTTPDPYAWYPLIIYVSNATGVYRYLPDSHPNATPMPDPNHAITKIVSGDKRFEIADACAGQVWAADAPAIFLIVYNSSYNDGDTGDGGSLPHEFMEVSAGAVIQELFLEASAWNLSANVVSEGLEEWNGTGAEELRSVLGLPPSAIPLYIVPVGVGTPFHNVAVKEVAPFKNVVAQNYSLSISVTAKNYGSFTETFNVTAYYNETDSIATQEITLAGGNVETVTFAWNTTGFAKGVYTISATATTVPNETDTNDNSYIDGTVRITILGDVAPEFGIVDIVDVVYVALSFGTEKGEPEYEPNADLNDDSIIDIVDIVIVAIHFGETDP